MIPILFLDMDGVTNGHVKYPNHYARTEWECVERVNRILREVPTAKVVISSSWRYMVHTGTMTVKGFENLMLALGFDVFERILDVTCLDEEYQGDMTKPEFYTWISEHGIAVRARQIQKWLDENPVWSSFAVLDDYFLPIPNMVQTDGQRGISDDDATQAIRLLWGSAL